MKMTDVHKSFSEVDNLFFQINDAVPKETIAFNELRSTLAGLLVISIASTYENCIREVLVDHADRHHPKFSYYIEREFEKMNSRISIQDLHKYAAKFSSEIGSQFKKS